MLLDKIERPNANEWSHSSDRSDIEEKHLDEGTHVRYIAKNSALSNDTRRTMAQLITASDKGYGIEAIVNDLVAKAFQDGVKEGSKTKK